MTILASSGSLEGIEKLMGEFFHSPNITVRAYKSGPHVDYIVSNSRGPVDCVMILHSKGRYKAYLKEP